MTDDPNVVTLSSGVVVRCKAAPLNLIRKLTTAVPVPAVPMKFNEEKGREEPNPFDPDYREASRQYDIRVRELTQDALIVLGTEIVSVPDGFPGPDEAAWREEVAFFGITIDERMPRLTWMNYYAIRGLQDQLAITVRCGRLTGVREEDVTAEMNNFRGDEARGADPSPAPAPDPGDGDPVRGPAAA